MSFLLARRHAPRRAFTLVELLIAGAISSMLLAALFAFLFGALRLRDAAWRNVESGAPREQVADLIRRDLQQAVAPAGVLAGTFLGQTSGEMRDAQTLLTFYAGSGNLSANQPWGEVQQIEYSLADPLSGNDDAGRDLLRRVTRNLLAGTVEEETDDTPWRMLGGIAALTLEFWDGDAWQTEWDSTAHDNANPRAVRVRIEFVAPQTGETPPPLEVVCDLATQPRAAATAGAVAAAGAGAGGGQPTPTADDPGQNPPATNPSDPGTGAGPPPTGPPAQ